MAKKIPMRMCVSCREMQPKKELVRVVRTPEGAVVLDTTGRANGRGAYLCKKSTCLEKAIKSRALERALAQVDPAAIPRILHASVDAAVSGASRDT